MSNYQIPEEQVIERITVIGGWWKKWLANRKAQKIIKRFNNHNKDKRASMVKSVGGPQYLRIKIYWEDIQKK